MTVRNDRVSWLVRLPLAIALLAASVAYLAGSGALAFVSMFGPSIDMLVIVAVLGVLALASVVAAIQLLVSGRRSLAVIGAMLALPGLSLIVLRYVLHWKL